MTRRSRRAAAAGAGGMLVAISGFLPWFRVLGTDLDGFRMADLITDFGSVVETVPPPWVGALWYVLPLLGVVSWLLLFGQAPIDVRGVHLALGTLVIVSTLVFIAVSLSASDLRFGPILAIIGGTMIAVAGLGRLKDPHQEPIKTVRPS